MNRSGQSTVNGHDPASVEGDLKRLVEEREALRSRQRVVAAEYGALSARIERLALQSRMGRPGLAPEIGRLQRNAHRLRASLQALDQQIGALQPVEQHLRSALEWEQLGRNW